MIGTESKTLACDRDDQVITSLQLSLGDMVSHQMTCDDFSQSCMQCTLAQFPECSNAHDCTLAPSYRVGCTNTSGCVLNVSSPMVWIFDYSCSFGNSPVITNPVMDQWLLIASAQYVQIDATNLINPAQSGSPMSLALWIGLRDNSETPLALPAYIFGSQQGDWGVGITESRTIFLVYQGYVWDSNFVLFQPAIVHHNLKATQYHIAVSFNTATDFTQLRLFVNGMYRTHFNLPVGPSSSFVTTRVVLGGQCETIPNYGFNGFVDDVRVYAILLSAGSLPLVMQDAYNTNLVAHWRLDGDLSDSFGRNTTTGYTGPIFEFFYEEAPLFLFFNLDSSYAKQMLILSGNSTSALTPTLMSSPMLNYKQSNRILDGKLVPAAYGTPLVNQTIYYDFSSTGSYNIPECPIDRIQYQLNDYLTDIPSQWSEFQVSSARSSPNAAPLATNMTVTKYDHQQFITITLIADDLDYYHAMRFGDPDNATAIGSVTSPAPANAVASNSQNSISFWFSPGLSLPYPNLNGYYILSLCSATNNINFFLNSQGSMTVTVGAASFNSSSSFLFGYNRWYWVQLSSNSNTWTLTINEVSVGSVSSTFTQTFTSVKVGASCSTALPAYGLKVHDIRVTVGSSGGTVSLFSPNTPALSTDLYLPLSEGTGTPSTSPVSTTPTLSGSAYWAFRNEPTCFVRKLDIFIRSSLPSSGQLYQTADGINPGAPITAVPTQISDPLNRVLYFSNTTGPFTVVFGYGADDFQLSSSNLATVTINVLPKGNDPVAIASMWTLQQDAYVNITFNVSDIDVGETVVAAIPRPPTRGTFYNDSSLLYPIVSYPYNLAAPYVLSFKPAFGQFGAPYTVVEFWALDSSGLRSPSVVMEINVTRTVDVPQAFNGTFYVESGTTASFEFSAFDPWALPFYYVFNSTPSSTYGTLIYAPNPTVPVDTSTQYPTNDFQFTALSGLNTVTSFKWYITTGSTSSVIATMTVNISAYNNPPNAYNSSESLDEDNVLLICMNATDQETASLSYHYLGLPLHGMLYQDAAYTQPVNLTSVTSKCVYYVPLPDYNGPDAIWFSAKDPTKFSNVAAVVITVIPVDDPLRAPAQNLSVYSGDTLVIQLIAEDPDNPSTTFTWIQTGFPLEGSLSYTGGDYATYTPTTTQPYVVVDHVQFSATCTACSKVTPSAIADITINILPINHPPDAPSQSISIYEDVPYPIDFTDFVSDPDLTPFFIKIVTAPTNGTLHWNVPGFPQIYQMPVQLPYNSSVNASIVYRNPLNSNSYTDTFDYVAFDLGAFGFPPAISPTATVSVYVNPVDDPPVTDSHSLWVYEHTLSIAVNLSFSDVDGPNTPELFNIQSLPSFGSLTTDSQCTLSVSVGPYASPVYYCPFASVSFQNDSFVYQQVNSLSTGLIEIWILPVNDPPVASDSSVEVYKYALNPINLTVTDPETPNELTCHLLTLPALGTLYLDATGNTAITTPGPIPCQLYYQTNTTPSCFVNNDLSCYDMDTLKFDVSDWEGLYSTSAAKLQLNIHGVNLPPTATPSSVDVFQSAVAATSFNLAGVDLDSPVPVQIVITGIPDGFLYGEVGGFQTQITSTPTTLSSNTLSYIPPPGVVGLPYTQIFFSVVDSDNVESPPVSCLIYIHPFDYPPTPIDMTYDIETLESFWFVLNATDDNTPYDLLSYFVETLPNSPGNLTQVDGTPVAQGDLAIHGANLVFYTTVAATYSFQFIARDRQTLLNGSLAYGSNSTVIGTVTFNVANRNEPPTVYEFPSNITLNEDSLYFPILLSSLGTDSDYGVVETALLYWPTDMGSFYNVSGDPASEFTGDAGPLVLNPSQYFYYSPLPNINYELVGDIQLKFSLSDSRGATTESYILLHIMPVPDTPVVSNFSVQCPEGETIAINFPQKSATGELLRYILQSLPTEGYLYLSRPDGTFPNQPASAGDYFDQLGCPWSTTQPNSNVIYFVDNIPSVETLYSTTFQYVALVEDCSTSNIGVVTVHQTAINRPPVAFGQNLQYLQGSVTSLDIVLDGQDVETPANLLVPCIWENPYDPSPIVSNPNVGYLMTTGSGSTTINVNSSSCYKLPSTSGHTVKYMIPSGSVRTDGHPAAVFHFSMFDGTWYSPRVTISIYVIGANNPPVAYNDNVTLDENVAFAWDPKVTDPDGTTSFTINITRFPTRGTLYNSIVLGVSSGDPTSPSASTLRFDYGYYSQNVLNDNNFWDYWTWTAKDPQGAESGLVNMTIFVRFVDQHPVAQDASLEFLLGGAGLVFNLTEYMYDVETPISDMQMYWSLLPTSGVVYNQAAPTVPITCSPCPTCGNNCTYPPILMPRTTDSFLFVPDPNAPLQTPFATLHWYLYDGNNYSQVAKLSINARQNTPPTVLDDSVYTYENQDILIQLSNYATDNETPNSQLLYYITSSPLRGNLTQFDGTTIQTCLDGCGIRIKVTDPLARLIFHPNLYDSSSYELINNVSTLTSYSGFSWQADDSAKLQSATDPAEKGYGLSSNIAFLDIIVNPIYFPPQARNDSVMLRERTPKTISVYGFNPETTTMNFQVLSLPAEGQLFQTLNGLTPIDANTPLTNADLPALIRSTSHQLYYVAPRVDSWSDALFYFDYNIYTINSTDNATAATFYSDLGRISITVRPVNQAPLAYDQSLEMLEDTNITIVLRGRDPNTLDATTIQAFISSLPTKGALYQYPANLSTPVESLDRIVTPYTEVLDGAAAHKNWRLLFFPAPNDNGVPYTDFEYFITDQKADSFPGRITISVIPVNDPPGIGQLVAQTAIAGADTILSIGGEDPDVANGVSQLYGFIVDTSQLSNSSLFQVVQGVLDRDVVLNFTPAVTRGAPILNNCTILTDPQRRVILAASIPLGSERSTLKIPIQFWDGILYSEVAEMNILVVQPKAALPSGYDATDSSWAVPLIVVGCAVISILIIVFIIWWRNNLMGDDEDYQINIFDSNDNDDDDEEVVAEEVDTKPRGPVERLLLDPKYQILMALLNAIDVTEYDAVAKSLVDIFEYHSCTLAMLKFFITLEVESATSAGTLFRANSIASKMMTAYTKMMGNEYLTMTLKVPIETIIKKDSALEVDPKKLKSGESRKANVRLLNLACQNFLDWIVSSSENAPFPFKILSNHLFQEVSKRFPTNKHIAVGGFLFLRFFCPAIISPEGFGVLQAAPPPTARRALVLIAKVLQNLANSVEFGKKEAYMIECNDFIQKNTQTVKTYFDAMVTLPYGVDNPGYTEIPPERLAAGLTVIQRYLYDNQTKIIDILEGKDGTHSERTDSHSTSRSGTSRSGRSKSRGTGTGTSGSKGSTRESSHGGSSKSTSRKDRSGSRSGSYHQPAFGEDSATDLSGESTGEDEFEPLDQAATKDIVFFDDDGAEYIVADDLLSDDDEIMFEEGTHPGEEFSVEEVGTETARKMGLQFDDWTDVQDLSLDDLWEKVEVAHVEEIQDGFNPAGDVVDPVLAFKSVMATIGTPDD